MNKKILLIIAGLLLAFGILRPNLNNLFNRPNNPVVVIDDINIPAPISESLRAKAKNIISALSVSNDRKIDGKRLASLYNDIASLIELDGENQVIRNTEEIRQANRLAGLMLRLDIKGKYPDLPEANQAVIIESIGDDQILLTPELRAKAVEGFKALAWACNEGSK